MSDTTSNLHRRQFLTAGVSAIVGLGLSDVGAKRKGHRKRSRDKKKDRGSRADAILTQLAWQVQHSFQDDGVPIDVLVARFDAGEILPIACGTSSKVGQALLARVGIRSRLVCVLTRGEFSFFDDGHTLLEVFEGNRWRVYDVDNDRAFSDNIVKLAAQASSGRTLSWRTLATDPPAYDQTITRADWEAQIHSWDARVFGVPMIYGHDDIFWAFHDASQRERVEGYQGSYRYVSKKTWKKIVNAGIRDKR